MKIIHLFFGNGTTFLDSIIEMVLQNKDVFNVEETLFVTTSQDIYELNKARVNIEIAKYSAKDFRIVKYYAKRCDRLIVHGFTNPLQALVLNKKMCSRIVWRSWGHDVFEFKESRSIKGVLKRIASGCYKKKVNRFHIISGSDFVDRYDLALHFNNKKIWQLEYPIFFNKSRSNILFNVKSEKSDAIQVLLGHSGIQNDNHISILKELKKFEDKKLHVNLVLSYGDDNYVASVIDYVKKTWREDKVSIITKKMSAQDYYSFLKSMDIAILDGKKSYALGNIEALLFFKKTIYLNDEGTLARAFKSFSVPFKKTSDLPLLSFDSFVEKTHYRENLDSIKLRSYDEIVESWKTACYGK